MTSMLTLFYRCREQPNGRRIRLIILSRKYLVSFSVIRGSLVSRRRYKASSDESVGRVMLKRQGMKITKEIYMLPY